MRSTLGLCAAAAMLAACGDQQGVIAQVSAPAGMQVERLDVFVFVFTDTTPLVAPASTATAVRYAVRDPGDGEPIDVADRDLTAAPYDYLLSPAADDGEIHHVVIVALAGEVVTGLATFDLDGTASGLRRRPVLLAPPVPETESGEVRGPQWISAPGGRACLAAAVLVDGALVDVRIAGTVLDCDGDGQLAQVTASDALPDCDDLSALRRHGLDGDGDGVDSCLDCRDDAADIFPGNSGEVCGEPDRDCAANVFVFVDGGGSNTATCPTSWCMQLAGDAGARAQGEIPQVSDTSSRGCRVDNQHPRWQPEVATCTWPVALTGQRCGGFVWGFAGPSAMEEEFLGLPKLVALIDPPGGGSITLHDQRTDSDEAVVAIPPGTRVLDVVTLVTQPGPISPISPVPTQVTLGVAVPDPGDPATYKLFVFAIKVEPHDLDALACPAVPPVGPLCELPGN